MQQGDQRGDRLLFGQLPWELLHDVIWSVKVVSPRICQKSCHLCSFGKKPISHLSRGSVKIVHLRGRGELLTLGPIFNYLLMFSYADLEREKETAEDKGAQTLGNTCSRGRHVGRHLVRGSL